MSIKQLLLFWTVFLVYGPRKAWQIRRETRLEITRWRTLYPERFPTRDEVGRLIQQVNYYKMMHAGEYPPEDELDAIIRRVVTFS